MNSFSLHFRRATQRQGQGQRQDKRIKKGKNKEPFSCRLGNKEGEAKITAFFFQGDFVSNYRSFLTGKPSDHFIEAMQDAAIYKINLQELKSLYDKHKNIERLGRLIAENLYLSVANRLDSFLFQTPEERYKTLIERNSRLLQEIPQYMIASYLGVKPETLSRIRTRK
jgi:CRP-like cAMP-binding protein